MKSLILIFTILHLTIHSQISSKDSGHIPSRQDSIFSVIDEMPNYPGGTFKMKEFIDKNIIRPPNYPKGKVYVKFIINKTGKVTNPQIIKGLDPACDKAAIDVVLKLQNFSIPKHNGRPVECPFNLPIEFK